MRQRADIQNWAINGRFLTQRVTGVQRYAYEIMMALDAQLAEANSRAAACDPADRSARCEKACACPNWLSPDGLGKGHAWDQLILPFCARAGVLNLGNFGPLLGPNPIVCIHDANVYIEPESYSRVFRMTYQALLPLIGWRARPDRDGVAVLGGRIGSLWRLPGGKDFHCTEWS